MKVRFMLLGLHTSCFELIRLYDRNGKNPLAYKHNLQLDTPLLYQGRIWQELAARHALEKLTGVQRLIGFHSIQSEQQ